LLGLTSSPVTARRLALYWGITPICHPVADESPEKVFKHVVQWGRGEGVLQSGSKVVLVASSQGGAKGHDQMLVHSVD